MPEITSAMIMELRDKTGLGIKKCKEALVETSGDIGKAIEELRKAGLAAAEKRMGRAASEGIVFSYIHGTGKLGVMLELNCETDFVAKTDEFKDLGKDLCMHIAASSPQWVAASDVPEAIIAKEREIYLEQIKGKPANIADKIADGKLKKFYQDNCLLEQVFVKDDSMTIENLVKSKIAKLGENIKINRFVRMELGK